MAYIGKNVLENLTTAMYERAFAVYREYIQNACDALDKAIKGKLFTKDEGVIDIKIDRAKREIRIWDNGTGLAADEFQRVLTTIADSQKDPEKEKGFRGIGRLGGASYCDKLIFVSSVKGEAEKSFLEWDGKKLKEVLGDKAAHPDAADFIDEITTYHKEPCEESSHYFCVIMEGVTEESEELLSEKLVIDYLEQAAPVPYANSFIFRAKIYDYIKENRIKLDEYTLLVNGNNIFKPYSTVIYKSAMSGLKEKCDEISDIAFKKFFIAGKLVAWLWYGVAIYEGQIPIVNKMRCIRVRKENIEIGDYQTLSKREMFKESRGNSYFIGELHILDWQLRPNARRDYFNQNSALKAFEEVIKPFFYKELYSLYHYANEVKKATQAITVAKEKAFEYQKKEAEGKFIDPSDKENAKKTVEGAKEAASKAEKKLALRKKATDGDFVKNRVYEAIQNKYKPKNDPPNEKVTTPSAVQNEQKYITQGLSKLSKSERKLVSKIYQIIKKTLGEGVGEDLIKKINSELQK